MINIDASSDEPRLKGGLGSCLKGGFGSGLMGDESGLKGGLDTQYDQLIKIINEARKKEKKSGSTRFQDAYEKGSWEPC